MAQIPAFLRLPIRLNHGPPIQQAVVTSGSKAGPARQEARTVKQDPLVTYSSLIPGGLHYMPGGLNLPRAKRMRSESSQPDWSPGVDGTPQFAKILRRFTVGLRKTLTAFCEPTVAVPMSPISAQQSGLWA